MKTMFIGWYNHDNSDKVWGIIGFTKEPDMEWRRYYQQGQFLTFWGRRSQKLQYKVKEMTFTQADTLIREKSSKGYDKIDESRLSEVYPDFEKHIDRLVTLGLLSI